MSTNAPRAVFTGNLAAYFAQPWNYVLIGLTVAVSTLIGLSEAASMASLLLVMLLGTASILISTWGWQRRQESDRPPETVGAKDTWALRGRALGIILRKYLAAALLYSLLLGLCLLVCYVVLDLMAGVIAIRSYLGGYLGHWLAGLVILGVGVCTTFASRAIFARNLVNYFASPTGYLFICVFVFFSSIAAFCPYDFFNSNLANLDQLNEWFPFIMLVFIPAIAMSIWADERRQGTDELLLTTPAGDFDIVLGKYLAAVAIFTVSLLFSGASNLAVLSWLGSPDLGLFESTYVGYWLVGLGMLAVGMVASFLTHNLTVAFILGAVFNAPLVAAVWADAVFGPRLAEPLKSASIGGQFAGFGRGVISLSAIAYFGMIVAVTLYLSMVLIGQRHWRSTYSAAVSWLFHLAVHLVWAALFVLGWWLLLSESFHGPGVLCGLMLLYLVVQTGLLCAWHYAVPGSIGATMPAHYLLRALVLVIVLVGVNVFFQRHDLRADITSEKLSSLADSTREMLSNLDVQRPVQIEAFISPTVPESYVQTQLNLRSALQELAALGGDAVQVQITDTDRFSEEAARAEQLYGITPRQVATMSRGVWSMEHLFMHVAVSCGLQKVDPVFFDRGIPTEYELVRSIATVSQQKRKRIGVIVTDAQLYGQFDFQSGSSGSNWPIIDELEKQYDVARVDLTKPIPEDEHYDVLLAVQPSSLGPEQMDSFIAAIQSGQPTAIFEDPMPYLAGAVPATSEERRPPGGMNPMLGRQPGPPKGDRAKLWDALGVIFPEQQIVWQQYNPYPNVELFTTDKEFVFVDEGTPRDQAYGGHDDGEAGGRDVFNQDDPISSKLQQVLFPFPGSISPLPSSSTDLQFIPLVRTGDRTGTIPHGRLMTMSMPFFRPRLDPNRYVYEMPTGDEYVLAAHLHGKGGANPGNPGNAAAATKKKTANSGASPKGKNGAGASPDAEKKPPHPGKINVVLVADIDMLTPAFFAIREEGNRPEADVHFDFDNVTFVLNVLDSLAGEERFLQLRKRRPVHRTLTRIEEQTKQAKQEATDAREKFIAEFNKGQQREQEAFDKTIESLKNSKNADPQQLLIQVAIAEEMGRRRLSLETERLQRERDTAIDKIETDLNLEILRVQHSYKIRAALFPLILPLTLAVVVFIYRRVQEREGVARTRLR
jgi:ABC-2 type transport system permease protein